MPRNRAAQILLGLTTLVLVVGLVSISWVYYAPCWMGGCAPVGELSDFQAEGSQLLDIKEQPIGTLASVNRRVVPLDSMPKYLPEAFVAVEDRRFYQHGGLDLRRVFGAFLSNVKAGGVAEGGSTITMQLARNLFPDWLPYTDRGMRRKIMEARVARQIERQFPKDKILELYINHIYLGNGAYGVEAASQAYFGKPAAKLTLAEAATLGGLPKAPSDLDPTENPEGATTRRNLVLGEMVRAGYVTQQEADAAKQEPLKLAEEEKGPNRAPGSYFVERVRREMQEMAGNQFYTAGLKIYTTLDSDAQRAAEEELARQLNAVESGSFGSFHHPTYAATRGKGGKSGKTAYLQGAVVMLDAHNGEIRALVGGRDFEDSKYNRAIQAQRQPGSAFKPFVYLSALQVYGSPAQIVQDAPVKMVLSDGRTWEPKNYTPNYAGPMTLRTALTLSKNTVTVRVSQDVGMDAVIQNAHQLGITTTIPNVPATALGAAEVRPIELVQSYAAFGNGGNRVDPHFIRKIVDRHGTVVWEARQGEERVIDPGAAFVLTTMLEDVVDRGTGTAVRAVGFTGPAAGKTGTTNSATDVWFVGYTPDLVTGIWMGFDEPQTIVRGASGGTLVAPAWGRLMKRVYAGRPMPAKWAAPSGITTAQVDATTGMAVSPTCPAHGPIYEEYFLHGPPAQTCAVQEQFTYAPLPGDSAWTDQEWALDPAYSDTLTSGAVAPGVSWPELEALRRRIRAGVNQQPAPVYPPMPSPTTSRPGVEMGSAPPSPPPAPAAAPPPPRNNDGLPAEPAGGGAPADAPPPPAPADTTHAAPP
jgi:penicillin-binding protein 1A